MQFSDPYIPATLVRRYKRFLADVELDNGKLITVHTPNTGAMLGVAEPGIRVWLRDTGNPKRKYRYSWEISEPRSGNFVGVHTGLVNALVSEAINNGTVRELQGYTNLSHEVPYGQENSRIDLLLEEGDRRCYVEIKNVTARDSHALAIFPDAVSLRGQKHLRELRQVARSGQRAVMLYCIQRADIEGFRPAHEIDPEYARLLRQVSGEGVEVLAYKAQVSPQAIRLAEAVALDI